MGRKRTLLMAATLVLAGFTVRSARLVVARHLLPTQGAQWIWAPDALRETDGVAFYALRDFELDPLPADLRVHILADESYVAYLNGQRFGSGAYVPGSEMDVYAVQSLVRPGPNRLVIELRSDRGAGGFLATATDSIDGSLVLRTDDEWSIHDRAHGLLDGAEPSEAGAAPVVWQTAPTGAWGAPSPGPIRPNYTDAADADSTHRPVGGRDIREGPRSPGGTGRRGQLFDFGEAVTGYLRLDGLARGPRRILASFGTEEHEARDPIRITRVQGQRFWTQAEAASFRYVRLWGALPETLEPSVVPVTRELAAIDAERRKKRHGGVFGLAAPQQ
ncbi:MAG: hypothetical protein VYE73_18620 [Acidobacteriota bacterium]|nr:hypothetical protein [Acidobacteriota bacterium]